MITRTLTLAGSQNIHIVLYFDSMESAEKSPTPISGEIALIEDDYKQKATVNLSCLVLDHIVSVPDIVVAQNKIRELVQGQPKA